MPKRLDVRLRAVAELRQVLVSTARSWRDSGLKKWADALEEVARENAKRKARGQMQLGSFH